MSGCDEPAVAQPSAAGVQDGPMGVERGGGAEVALNGGAAAAAAVLDEPPRKRPKVMLLDDASALRKRVLEYKLLRLKQLRERFTEQLSELYFLQAGCNMMDYATWRKRPPEPRLVALLEARRPAPPPPPQPPPPQPPPPASAPAPQDEMVEKAKQEAYVAARVAELARAGLWADKRLPRVCEPPRAKTHWDYLLEEMAWLAQDFAQERKWKKQAAKKCARAVQKYFQDKAAAAQKAEKAQEMQLKRIAAFAAKEIRTFWGNVEKLVEWKRVRRVERARKEALDEQLSYIVDRTERYSRQLAASIARPAPASAPASDDEFQPRGASDDDEETIAAAEREARLGAADHRHELEALRRESRQELGDLLPPGYLRAAGDDYLGTEDSADDEDTIAEQERTERAEDTAAELDALRSEADLDLVELRSRYNAPPPHQPDADSDSDSNSNSDSSSTSDSSASERLEALVEGEGVAVAEAGAEAGGSGSGSQRVEAAASLAASLQPTGTTLSETAVGTAVPRLLRHELREYQHVGLHWLATMHARRLNGILADEMGLGKTIQSIALLAHLALEHRDWGPHLVVAPTSVVLNWEMEFKKWCPAFKILTYYGTIKERKLKRVGWTKANSFHVCITSYKLVVQDHQSFRRKRWKYLILDEAQNIKNFKSQRWQMLLNFQTERRLLLTGTPLQNSLLELWSLMHFLMPDVFASHSTFREWFSPVSALAGGAGAPGDEGGASDALVRRLHEVLRPFLLRRLKADVERQMPRKYDHVLLCRLSKRQRFLYDDFMARAKTKESLASGNLLSVINVLMQLRKVCNHPDLFEPRPVSSPLHLPALRWALPALVFRTGCAAAVELAARLGGDLATLEASGAGAFPAHRATHLAPPRRLVEELADTAPPPRPPPAQLRLHLRLVPRTPPATPLPPVAHSHPAPPRPAAVPRAPRGPHSPALARLERRRRACLRRLASVNERRCWRLPLYGVDLRAALNAAAPAPPPALAPPDLPGLLDNMHHLIDRFSVCWMPAIACGAEPQVGAGGGAREWRRHALAVHAALAPPAARALALLHAPAARQRVAFPHPRLLQYDCGKLQTLDSLLRRLKAGGHRVLIFTQMTRVLDVLEAFLSLHGHTYLRLDGATRVERRQALVDRFNADRRVFAFILSTRSGGVGLNLTGADAVVFYDSDWNPTMDAQAQDRCHRIGQTRDVHVYRLVTAATIEENILRKAEQKRALGHLAIEDGHFTTSYLKASNIKDLFGAETGDVNAPSGDGESGSGGGEQQLESALAAAEDEADAAAARAARAEAVTDLAEFDESVPLQAPAQPDDESPDHAPRAPHAPHTPAKPPDELTALMDQLTPIEKYAMRLVENSEAATEAERSALNEMQKQLREWEQARRALRDEDLPPAEPDPEPELELTYSREDAAQVWVSDVGGEQVMPMWCPPTPPSSDGDMYCESWSLPLYRRGAAAEALLPGPGPAARREPRAPRDPRHMRPPRLHRAAHAPPSLFERAAPRPRVRASRHHPAAHPHPRDLALLQPDWSPAEDAALRRSLRLQRLPVDAPPALVPNWEWVAELVSDAARAYRSPRACRDRHDALADPDRARRKQKKQQPARRRPTDEPPRLHHHLRRLDAMRELADRRRAAPKRRHDDSAQLNPKHTALLADSGVDLDSPPTPMELAARRADRIAKEKQKAGANTSVQSQPQPQTVAVPASTGAAGTGGALQRVVVAASAGRGEVPRRPRPAVSATPAPAAAPAGDPSAGAASPQLVYRQQAMPPRHHLKILHHAQTATQSLSGSVPSVSGETLRSLQLQQLSLRRAPAPAPRGPAPAPRAPSPRAPSPRGPPRLVARAHSHVVVTQLAPHLAPAAPHPPPPPPPPDRS